MLHKYHDMKKLFLGLFLVGFTSFLGGCGDDPEPENIPELITKVTLTFTPTGGSPFVVTATDPDGEGSQDLQIDGPITLVKGTPYTLAIELINGLYDPGEDGYNITEEVRSEGEEHQFFFSWSDGSFSVPTGTGNIGSNGVVNYQDEDESGLPIGLTTEWTTATTPVSGKSFRIVLKHQPGIKSSTSTSADGESDLDITFGLTIN